MGHILLGILIIVLIVKIFGSLGIENGCGCLLVLVLTFVAWRLGVLGFIFGILRWILIRVVYYLLKIYEFFSETVFGFV